MQERTIDEITGEHKKLREILAIQPFEDMKSFDKRMFVRAEEKLKDPKTVTFTQIRIKGRNQPCPCGSGKKFKKCCWNKANIGEFEVSP